MREELWCPSFCDNKFYMLGYRYVNNTVIELYRTDGRLLYVMERFWTDGPTWFTVNQKVPIGAKPITMKLAKLLVLLGAV